jgi:YidC/Oxa1 family membrane protein insertase
MENNRNIILAVVLSMVVLFGWQFFVAGPQLQRQQEQAQIAAEQAEAEAALATPTTGTTTAAGTPGAVAADGTAVYADRAAAIAATSRVVIDTEDLHGSINLTGARLDDLELKQYRETVDPTSPIITLLTPSGAPNSYFAEQGWVAAAGATIALPDSNSVWAVEGDATTLTAATPVTLVWNNGAGLIFRRTFAVDEHYLFTVTQSVENTGTGDVALFPYARVARHGTPKVANFFIQHEGPHGVLGSNNLVSKKYSDIQKEQQARFDNTTGWLGFSDKYWATAVLPKAGTGINALFSWKNTGTYDDYQTSFVETTPVVVAPGATATHESYLFAGAKEESVISAYQTEYGFDRLSS